MQKLKLKALELGAVLTREEMKNVVGGKEVSGYCGTGSGCSGTCIESGMSCGNEPSTGSCMCDYYS
jgi:hypothetical protein